jgi:hypothetical protein
MLEFRVIITFQEEKRVSVEMGALRGIFCSVHDFLFL